MASIQAANDAVRSQQPESMATHKTQDLAASTSESREHSSPVSGTPLPRDRSRDQTTIPQFQRRSSAQMLQRPGSSSSPRLVRKGSRSSMASSPVGNDDGKKLTPKRSISNLITELRGAQATMESIPEPVILTAPQIAQSCFTQDLSRHEDAESTQTMVLLHDACYGHRFSRLKTSKATLSMIVERPERILASVLGIATAYVRIGGYHSGAHNAPHPKHEPTSSPPFKIRRTDRVLNIKSPYVTSVHGTAWMSELQTLCEVAQTKLTAGEKEVARTTSITGEDKRSLHEGDLYLCQESLNAFEGALGGVADAVDAVFLPSMHTKRAFVAVRPPGHHCSADYPSGFCWINNVHVGIEYAAQTHNLTHAAIIDFDLHHGDGSQSIAWERNSKNNYRRLYAKGNAKLKLNPDIGYYSLHDINSYPCEMGDDEKVQAASLCVHNAHGQSIWNVHLQPWKTLDEFWTLYETQYKILLDKAYDFLRQHTSRIIAEGKQRPRSAIFISAGFDASEWEGEGMQRHKVNVPTEFYARFTQDILKLSEEAGTGCDGRVISVLEGGYSDRALCSSTLSHITALCSDGTGIQQKSNLGMSMQSADAGALLDQNMRALSLAQNVQRPYDVDWWSPDNLTALEHHVNPPTLSAGGKKMRNGPQPTYATPTESFAYKVIDPAKFARSVSGTMREGSIPTRPVTPPPPEVDWIVAAHELSKLLIPADRATTSCTAEELAGPKVKKERHSDIGVAMPDDLVKGRQLRTRGKNELDQATEKRKVSNSDRRKTMADVPSLLAEADALPVQSRRTSRRSSLASTTSNAPVLSDIDAPPVPAVPQNITRPMPLSRTPSAGNVQMKKMRPPAATTAKPKKSTSPTERPVSANGQASAPTASRSPRKAAPPATPKSKSTNENSVDALASGMKRITLKVGSRKESERRAKEKLDAERRARALKAAETRRVNKAAREAKALADKTVAASITQHIPVASENAMSPEKTSSVQTYGLTTDGASNEIGTTFQSLEASQPVFQQPPPAVNHHTLPNNPLAVNAGLHSNLSQSTYDNDPLYQQSLMSHNQSYVQPLSNPQAQQPQSQSLLTQNPAYSQQFSNPQAQQYESVTSTPFYTGPPMMNTQTPNNFSWQQQQPLSGAMPGQQLPQFTSTSHIPFAGMNSAAMSNGPGNMQMYGGFPQQYNQYNLAAANDSTPVDDGSKQRQQLFQPQ